MCKRPRIDWSAAVRLTSGAAYGAVVNVDVNCAAIAFCPRSFTTGVTVTVEPVPTVKLVVGVNVATCVVEL